MVVRPSVTPSSPDWFTTFFPVVFMKLHFLFNVIANDVISVTFHCHVYLMWYQSFQYISDLDGDGSGRAGNDRTIKL